MPNADFADVNGQHIFYSVRGAGKPLILLHGGINSDSFRSSLGELAKGAARIVSTDTNLLYPFDQFFFDIPIDRKYCWMARYSSETPEIVFVTAHSSFMEQAFVLHRSTLHKPHPNGRVSSVLTYFWRKTLSELHARARQFNVGGES